MGTDIHMRAEIKFEEKWHPVGAIFPYEYFDPFTELLPEDKRGWGSRSPLTPSPYDGRNYTLFAVLGNVRNGYGFAGVERHKPIEPISDSRGLPDDLADHDYRLDPYYSASDEEGEEDYDRKAYIFGDHSKTFVTLREIMDYDWDQPLHRTGVLSPNEYLRVLDEQDTPRSWSGGISGPGIDTLSEGVARTMDREELLATRTGEPPKPGPFGDWKHYVQYHWTQPLRDGIGDDFFRVIRRMRSWQTPGESIYRSNTTPEADDHCWSNPDNIRLVFGFDS